MSKATDSAFEQNASDERKKDSKFENQMKWNSTLQKLDLTSTPWASVFLFDDEMSALEMCTFIVKELKYKTVLDFHMTESYLKYN